MNIRSTIGFFAIVLTVVGCRSTGGRSADTAPQAATTAAAGVPDQWLGQWDGPEGTFLRLSRAGERYVVVIQNLDGPRTFDGVNDGGRVRFVRDGKTEYIVSGDGHASGMKWLADKKSCLLTRAGEGWCRD